MRHITSKIVLSTILLCSAQASLADGFNTFGDVDRLGDQKILSAGNISNADPSNDPAKVGEKLYRLGAYCFKSDDDAILPGMAALVLVDFRNQAHVALLSSSISGIDVKVVAVDLIKCSAVFKKMGDDSIRKLQEQIEKNREMAKKLQRQSNQ